MISQVTEAKKPGLRGEHEGNRKTIAQGMPVDFGEPVVTTLVCFFHLHARLWVRRASGIPCALFAWRARSEHQPGRGSRRGNTLLRPRGCLTC
jgi:hypothetical protein